MLDPVLEALWKKVLDGWDDDSAHAKFLEHCRETQQLPEAAARYRGMTGDRARAESAEKRLKGVAIVAMASLETMRSPEPRRAKRVSGIVMSIFFIVASILLLNLFAR